MDNGTIKMIQNKASDKISLRQAMLIFLTIILSPDIRVLPQLTAKIANQAGWLAPLVTFVFAVVLLIIIITIYKKFQNEQISLMDIIYKVFGNLFGKIIVFIYFLYITFLAGLFIRYFGERLISTILSPININLVIIPFLIIIAYIFKKGIVTFARMIEILLPIVIFVFIFCCICLIPSLHIKYLLPISTNDALPIFKASYITTGVFSYFAIIFFLGDKITNKSNLKKMGFYTIIAYTIISITVILVCIGSLSYYLIGETSFSFLMAIKQIKLFNTFEKLESIIIPIWIASDFAIITFFIFAALNILKSLIKTKEEGRFSNIYIAFLYILSFVIVGSNFELKKLSADFLTYSNVFLFYVLPLILLIVGKIRKKI
jgi:spore germination protein KB